MLTCVVYAKWATRGPILSTHQRVIASAIFKETDGRILISFSVWKANTILF